jgi:F-type H+-transporting ATPase subunit a
VTGFVLAAEEPTFEAPAVEDAFFHDGLSQVQISSLRAMILLLLGVVIVIAVMLPAARRAKIVPGRLAFFGESIYGFVRNGIARDVLGRDGAKYVPLLVSLFLFVIIQNLFGIIPFAQHAPTSQFAVPVLLAALVYLVYVGAGIKHHGFFGFFKSQIIIPGVPPAMHIILVPIEFLSNLVLRPVTLAIRLFANMFAGHMLVLVASTGTIYLLQSAGALKALAILPFIGSLVLVFFELLIAALQAYVFTILTAVYIQTSIADEH